MYILAISLLLKRVDFDSSTHALQMSRLRFIHLYTQSIIDCNSTESARTSVKFGMAMAIVCPIVT